MKSPQEIRQLYGNNPSNIFHRAILKTEMELPVTDEEEQQWILLTKLQEIKQNLIIK